MASQTSLKQTANLILSSPLSANLLTVWTHGQLISLLSLYQIVTDAQKHASGQFGCVHNFQSQESRSLPIVQFTSWKCSNLCSKQPGLKRFLFSIARHWGKAFNYSYRTIIIKKEKIKTSRYTLMLGPRDDFLFCYRLFCLNRPIRKTFVATSSRLIQVNKNLLTIFGIAIPVLGFVCPLPRSSSLCWYRCRS